MAACASVSEGAASPSFYQFLKGDQLHLQTMSKLLQSGPSRLNQSTAYACCTPDWLERTAVRLY